LETNSSNTYLRNVCGSFNTSMRSKYNAFCCVIVPKEIIRKAEMEKSGEEWTGGK